MSLPASQWPKPRPSEPLPSADDAAYEARRRAIAESARAYTQWARSKQMSQGRLGRFLRIDRGREILKRLLAATHRYVDRGGQSFDAGLSLLERGVLRIDALLDSWLGTNAVVSDPPNAVDPPPPAPKKADRAKQKRRRGRVRCIVITPAAPIDSTADIAAVPPRRKRPAQSSSRANETQIVTDGSPASAPSSDRSSSSASMDLQASDEGKDASTTVAAGESFEDELLNRSAETAPIEDSPPTVLGESDSVVADLDHLDSGLRSQPTSTRQQAAQDPSTTSSAFAEKLPTRSVLPGPAHRPFANPLRSSGSRSMQVTTQAEDARLAATDAQRPFAPRILNHSGRFDSTESNEAIEGSLSDAARIAEASASPHRRRQRLSTAIDGIGLVTAANEDGSSRSNQKRPTTFIGRLVIHHLFAGIVAACYGAQKLVYELLRQLIAGVAHAAIRIGQESIGIIRAARVVAVRTSARIHDCLRAQTVLPKKHRRQRRSRQPRKPKKASRKASMRRARKENSRISRLE